ncbi:MAG: SpoIIE family protein phosphatase, partial [Clostridia bacterium]|nr:SpoIIE family protein phosphatase [Clostridia bacterium]
VLPGKVNRFFNKLFSPPPEAPLVEGLRNSIVMRLAFAADALRDVSQTVEEVSAKLKKINAPSFEHIFQKTEDNACARCSMRIYCWESNKGETLSALLFATKKIRKTGTVQPEDLPTPFTEHCLHLERVLDTLTVHLNDFLAKDAAGRRLEEIRGVIAEQFQGIAQMLGGLSEEFHTASRYDYDTAAQIRSGLLSMEINPLDISCQIDQYGRLTAEIRLLREDNKKINRSILLRELGEKCDRDFESPTLSDAGKSMLLTLSEKAEYTVDFGVAQYSYRNNKLCGDAYQGFFDGRGRFVMIVSDGMGKGGRAAVDGTMASGLMARLIKAGFDPDSALKIVNSAMLYKSTDESLATIDVTVLDLFSGITEFFKAGAPPTIIRKNGKSGIAAGENLPAGIVSQVAFDHTQTSLTKGDVIVMMSDGALGDGTDWIGVELEVWNAPGATALAEHLADYAKRRCTEQQSDDITVAVAIIEKSY